MSQSGNRGRHAVVFVRDFADVGLPADVARDRFCGEGDWLAPLASRASLDGESLLVRIGPSPSGSRGSIEVRINLGECRPQGEGGVVPIRWEATRVSGLFPVLDGNLELVPLGPAECRLILNASYRPPLDGFGLLLDRTLLHRVAESTIRSFLGRVAESLRSGGEEGSR